MKRFYPCITFRHSLYLRFNLRVDNITYDQLHIKYVNTVLQLTACDDAPHPIYSCSLKSKTEN